jgi:predicted nucleic acid-binding protein
VGSNPTLSASPNDLGRDAARAMLLLDAWIAATALSYGATLIGRDKGFVKRQA